MFNKEFFSLCTVSKVVAYAWVFFVTVYFLASVSYPYLNEKNLTAAYANGRAAGQQETYNAAMQTFSGNTFQNGQQIGAKETVGQLLDLLGKQYDAGCKDAIPVPLPNGTGSVGILSVPCYQKIQQAMASQSGQIAPEAPAQAPQAPAPARK